MKYRPHLAKNLSHNDYRIDGMGRLKSREWTLREWLVVEKVCAHRKVSVIHLVGLCIAIIFGSHVAYNHETEGYVFWTCQLKEREYWLFLDIYDVTKYWTSQMQ